MNFNNRPKDSYNAKYLFYPPQQDLLQRLNNNNPIQEIHTSESDELNKIGDQALQHAKSAVKKFVKDRFHQFLKQLIMEVCPVNFVLIKKCVAMIKDC